MPRQLPLIIGLIQFVSVRTTVRTGGAEKKTSRKAHVHPTSARMGPIELAPIRIQSSKPMAASALNAFQKAIEATRRSLQGFAEFFEGVRYNYYNADPPNPVPEKVWHYIADQVEIIPYEALEISPDGTACLVWDTALLENDFDAREVAVRKFELLCRQCFLELREHLEQLAAIPQLQTIGTMPSGHHQWIRLIHWVAVHSPVWRDLVTRRLIVSQRPREETLIDDFDWEEDQWQLVERVVRELNAQGESVPDIWFEHIADPHLVVRFHSQMLDVLEGIVINAHVTELTEGTLRLADFEKTLIRALDRDALPTSRLCDKLSTMTGKVYGESGQVKAALSNLVKHGCMTSDRQAGYELTELGLRILSKLTK